MDLFATRIATRSVEDLDGIPLLTLSTTPSDSLALAAKRAFDLFEAAVALLVLAPVFLVVAVAIRLESPGPIFFRQRRVGVYGREFNLYKFRSMYQDAEARLESLRARNEVSGPVFKMRDDPRVTRVGRFIRRASIDELPQFWNVLRGEMSVVGPRPPLPSEVKQYERWQLRRLSVKPGITCTWQVSGRSQISFEQWMELDLRYIDSWSLWQDVKILARTIPAVLTGRGAQ
jgi:exopolysaccharide biosynthesis polyprenyl glycosylphosphotransferase